MKKKFIALLSLLMLPTSLIVSCKSQSIGTIGIRLSTSEIEVGKTVTVTSTLKVDDESISTKSIFKVDNEELVSIKVDAKGRKATLTALKPGTVTITCTAEADKKLTASKQLTIIAKLPTLEKCIENIQATPSYIIKCGGYDNVAVDFNLDYNYTYVDENFIFTTDQNGDPVVEDKDENYVYGEYVSNASDAMASYVLYKNNQMVLENNESIRSNIGALRKDNFKGRKDNAKTVNEVGMFASFDAINPAWVKDIEKNEDNYYTLNGDLDKSTNKSVNQPQAFVETLLWQIADYNSYAEAVTNEAGGTKSPIPSSIAANIETEVTVLGSNRLKAVMTVDKDRAYALEIISKDDDLEEANDIKETFVTSLDNITSKPLTIASDLDNLITTINQNNYVQDNYTYPDHKTEMMYTTYYTPNYIFHNCSTAFIKQYNETRLPTGKDFTHTGPYGYVKKSDGIYNFDYIEELDDNGDITKAEVKIGDKVEGTDASSEVYKYAKYFSTLSFLSNDLKYSFSDTKEQLWTDRGSDYYISGSYDIFDEILNSYDADDDNVEDEDEEEDQIETTQVGISIKKSNNAIDSISIEATMVPFSDDEHKVSSITSMGSIRFSLKDFSKATTNPVDALLTAELNK